MGIDNPSENYSYSGHLVFNGIYELDPFPEEEVFSHLSSVTVHKDVGRERFDSLQSNFLKRYKYLLADFKTSYPNTLPAYRYVFQELIDQEAYVEGELKNVKIPEEKSADLFFLPPTFLFIRGSEQATKQARHAFLQLISNESPNTTATPIEFDTDFLLWLFYNHWINHPIGHDIEIANLTDAKVVGERDSYGKFNRVSGSASIVRSVPILNGLLRGQKLTMLGGHFLLGGQHALQVDIQNEKVHIKTSQGDIRSYDDTGRILLSVLFLERLCEIYTEWRNLPLEERYPSNDFFEDVHSELQEEGFELNYSIESIVNEYQVKRGEPINDE